MRTEEDLRNALDRIAAKAPDLTPLLDSLPAVRPARRQRRTTLVVATVVATAAAAIGGPIVVDRLRDAPVQPAGEQAGSPWRNWVTLTAPAGMIVNPRSYEANRQVYQLAGVGSPWARWCLVTVHRNGDFDPGKIPAGSPRIDLNGLAGRLVTMPNGEPIVPFPAGYAMASDNRVRPVTTVVWQPAKGIWALASCERQQQLGTLEVPTIDAPSDTDSDTAVAIAKTVKATPRQLSAPFKIGYVPNGLQAQRVRDKTANFTGDGHSFSVVFTDGNPATGVESKSGTVKAGGLWGPQPMTGEDLEIAYTTDKFWNQKTRFEEHDPSDLTIHGWKAWYTADQLVTAANKSELPRAKEAADNGLRMERNGVAITIRTFGGPADKAQLRKIAESLTLPKNPSDTKQWYDATTAIPR
jgi:hypothetical protein